MSFSCFFAWLLRLWSVFWSKLPNRAFSSFALQTNGTSVRTAAGGAPRREGSKRARLTSPGRCLAASPVLGTWCLVLLPCQSGPPPLRAPSVGLSSPSEDGSLYTLCSVTSQLPANGERGAATPGDFLTQIFPQFKHRTTLTTIEGTQKSCFVSCLNLFLTPWE